jgi:hypothetical protein
VDEKGYVTGSALTKVSSSFVESKCWASQERDVSFSGTIADISLQTASGMVDLRGFETLPAAHFDDFSSQTSQMVFVVDGRKNPSSIAFGTLQARNQIDVPLFSNVAADTGEKPLSFEASLYRAGT